MSHNEFCCSGTHKVTTAAFWHCRVKYQVQKSKLLDKEVQQKHEFIVDRAAVLLESDWPCLPLDFSLQFVPFRDYIDRSGNQVLSMARLAKDVLAEIPDQLLSFMKSRGIEPRPALSSSPLPDLSQRI